MKRTSTVEVIKSGDAWSRMAPADRLAYAKSKGWAGYAEMADDLALVKSGSGNGNTEFVDADGKDIPDGFVIPIEAFKTMAGEVGKHRKELASMKAEHEGMLKHIAALLNPDAPRGSATIGGGIDLGAVVAKSEEFQRVFGSITALTGREGMVTVKTALLKAILSNATGVPDKTRLAGIVPGAPQWSSFLFARCAPGTMTGGVLEYVQDTTAPVDPSVPPTAEGALKPEVSYTFELKSVKPKTIAHWLEASKQILADAAALGPYLNNVLLHYLSLKLEHQVVNGDGTTTNMTGILSVAAAHGAPVAGDNPLDTIRKAIGVVEASGWLVDTIGINPIDWAMIQTLKGSDDHYLYATPAASSTGAQPAWGKIIVPTPAIAANSYVVGAFQQGSQLFEREAGNVVVGFQNDNFTRNLVTLLAEMRADLAIYAASAFRKGALS